MIISHKHKFIFFAIPKTGTHSVRFALRPQLSDTDEEHVSLYHTARLNIPEFNDRVNGHFSVKEIRPFINDEIWDEYFKFSFVRNPWDRFVSTIFFKNRSLKDAENVLEYMKNTIQNKIDLVSTFYRPQVDYVVDANNNPALDFIGKTENMQTDFDLICDRLKIPSVRLGRKNTSVHQDYKKYYDDELKNMIGSFYKNDIEMFDYTF